MISLLSELENIDKEIKNRLKDLSVLRKREKELKEKIKSFCIETDKPGLKYKDITVVLQDKTKHVRTKKEERIQQCKKLLRDKNIAYDDKFINDLIKSFQGKEVKDQAVKLVKRSQ